MEQEQSCPFGFSGLIVSHAVSASLGTVLTACAAFALLLNAICTTRSRCGRRRVARHCILLALGAQARHIHVLRRRHAFHIPSERSP